MRKILSWNNDREYTERQTHGFKAIIGEYLSKNGYSPLDRVKFAEILEQINKTGLWKGDQIISAWYQMTMSRQTSTYKNFGNISTTTIENISAENLLKIASKYDVGPLALTKKSLKARGFNKKLIKSWAENPNEIFDEEIWKLVVTALKNDVETPHMRKILFQKSVEYEEALEKLLVSKKIKFKTQNQLVEEQVKLHGVSVLTPDFLLESPLYIVVTHPDNSITEHNIHWIDAKNYMFLGRGFLSGKIKAQAKKYNDAFGPGAFIFHYGFVNSVIIPETVLLSSSEPFEN